MKMHNIVLILAITSINHITTARDIRIQIKNEYQKPITLNINSENYILNTNDAESLKYTSVDVVVAAAKVVQIKAQGAWHKGINVGFAKAAAAAKQNPTAHIIEKITILNTPTYKAHFEYNFEEPKVITLPQTTPIFEPIDLVMNGFIDDFLNKVIQDKIYGPIMALKTRVIKESQYNGTNPAGHLFMQLKKEIGTNNKINSKYRKGDILTTINNKQDLIEKVNYDIDKYFMMLLAQQGHPGSPMTLPDKYTKENLLPFINK